MNMFIMDNVIDLERKLVRESWFEIIQVEHDIIGLLEIYSSNVFQEISTLARAVL